MFLIFEKIICVDGRSCRRLGRNFNCRILEGYFNFGLSK